MAQWLPEANLEQDEAEAVVLKERVERDASSVIGVLIMDLLRVGGGSLGEGLWRVLSAVVEADEIPGGQIGCDVVFFCLPCWRGKSWGR